MKKIQRKRGRPKVTKGNFKGVYLGARFSPDEAKSVEVNVKKSGLKKSEFIRTRLLAE